MPAWIHTARHAWHGLIFAWKHEANFRRHVFIAACVCLASAFFSLARWEWAFVLVVIMMVLVLELLNTSLERLLDILEPRWSAPVKEVKDLLAGMVFVAACFAGLIGLLIFLPQIFRSL